MSCNPISSDCNQIELLIPIWQTVLKKRSVNLDENFFDVGGDAGSAKRLFTEITKATGRRLPAVTIYQTPTIAKLASLLEDPRVPEVPGVIRLRAGSIAPSVFIAHGLGDSVLDLQRLASRLQTNLPVYGLQARGLAEGDDPSTSVQEMASFHLRDIRHLQPRGPYILFGYSLGGLIALEIARELLTSGEKVSLVAMLDAYPHARTLSKPQRVRLRSRQVARRLATLARLPVREAFTYVADSIRRGDGREVGNTTASDIWPRFRESGYLALERYHPQLYPGPVRFVRAKVWSGFPKNAAAVWKKWIPELKVETIPSDHFEMLTTRCDYLAAVLSRYIQEVLPETT